MYRVTLAFTITACAGSPGLPAPAGGGMANAAGGNVMSGGLAGGVSAGGTSAAGGLTGGGSAAGGITGGGGTSGGGVTGGGSAPGTNPLVQARPFALRVPMGYRAGTPTPLVVTLHGYGGNGMLQAEYFGLNAEADRSTFLLASPDGTADSSGRRFWAAGSACCNFLNAPIDDVAYLTAIVEDVKARYTVDEKRIFVIGHSNGGFMAHRLACERSNLFAGIVSLAGAAPQPSDCTPSAPVAVLHVHGTADGTINFQGGSVGLAPFPGAVQGQTSWAMRNGCSNTPMMVNDVDFVPSLNGAETHVQRFPGCTGNSAVELWSIEGGPHIPMFNRPVWSAAIYAFLTGHPKP